jgi:hypothetical protein
MSITLTFASALASAITPLFVDAFKGKMDAKEVEAIVTKALGAEPVITTARSTTKSATKAPAKGKRGAVTGTCKREISKGDRAGQACGKNCYENSEYCGGCATIMSRRGNSNTGTKTAGTKSKGKSKSKDSEKKVADIAPKEKKDESSDGIAADECPGYPGYIIITQGEMEGLVCDGEGKICVGRWDEKTKTIIDLTTKDKDVVKKNDITPDESARPKPEGKAKEVATSKTTAKDTAKPTATAKATAKPMTKATTKADPEDEDEEEENEDEDDDE